MRRALLIIATILVVVLLAGFSWVSAVEGVRYSVPKIDRRVEVSPAQVALGKHWVTLLCAGCHLDEKTGALTGRRMLDLPAELGQAYSRNITQHPIKGIGSWTDGELIYLLRTGVTRDGRYVPPWMVKLPHMSDADLESIIAFLRSDHPWVAPRDVDNRASEPSLLAKALIRAGAFAPLDYPPAEITRTSTTNRVAYGKYLNESLDCYQCHSANFKSNDSMNPERSVGFMGGGNPLNDMSGRIVYSTNLTFDLETGIGKWSKDDFRRAVKEARRPDGSRLRYPMEPLVELSDDEVDALYDYFATVPKLKNKPPTPDTQEAAAQGQGERIYRKYGCAGCHGDLGDGACDLRKGPEKYPTDEALMAFIKRPIAVVPGSRMPAWDGVIHDEEWTPLLAHLRSLAK